MSKIQIFTVLGKNGVIFSDFLRETMIGFKSRENELEFNCFASAYRPPSEGWNWLESILKQSHTSLNHTSGLNRIIDYINGDYIVITDTDIAILCPNWDKVLIEKMEKENLDILGVGIDAPMTYRNFPAVTFFIAKSDSYIKINPDLRPDIGPYTNQRGIGVKTIKIETEEESNIFNLRIGKTMLKDSGWQLPLLYKENNLRGMVFSQLPIYTIDKVPQLYALDGQYIVAHKGKGSKRRQSKALEFIKSIKQYFAKNGIILS